MVHTLAPGTVEKLAAQKVEKEHFFQDKAAPPGEGNLFTPMPEYASISGGWQAREGSSKAPLLVLAAAAIGTLLGAATWWVRARHRHRGWLGAIAERVAA